MLVAAAVFFLYQKQYIIFNIPGPIDISPVKAQKKQIEFFFFQEETIRNETQPVIFTDIPEQNMHLVVSRWLEIAFDEKIISKKITLQSAIASYDSKELYLSFDSLLWNKESSTFYKWTIIEGILKTIKNLGCGITGVHFLINHQIMYDYHLDFTNPWPIDGFMNCP